MGGGPGRDSSRRCVYHDCKRKDVQQYTSVVGSSSPFGLLEDDILESKQFRIVLCKIISDYKNQEKRIYSFQVAGFDNINIKHVDK